MNTSPEAVALVPPAVVTVTSTAPAAWAGAVAVIEVALFTAKLVAAVEPKLTAVAPLKPEPVPEPVIVTEVPPVVVPVAGEMFETTGAKI